MHTGGSRKIGGGGGGGGGGHRGGGGGGHRHHGGYHRHHDHHHHHHHGGYYGSNVVYRGYNSNPCGCCVSIGLYCFMIFIVAAVSAAPWARSDTFQLVAGEMKAVSASASWVSGITFVRSDPDRVAVHAYTRTPDTKLPSERTAKPPHTFGVQPSSASDVKFPDMLPHSEVSLVFASPEPLDFVVFRTERDYDRFMRGTGQVYLHREQSTRGASFDAPTSSATASLIFAFINHGFAPIQGVVANFTTRLAHYDVDPNVCVEAEGCVFECPHLPVCTVPLERGATVAIAMGIEQAGSDPTARFTVSWSTSGRIGKFVGIVGGVFGVMCLGFIAIVCIVVRRKRASAALTTTTTTTTGAVPGPYYQQAGAAPAPAPAPAYAQPQQGVAPPAYPNTSPYGAQQVRYGAV